MAHTAPVDLDDLATLAGACNIANAPDANDIAALHLCSSAAEPSSGVLQAQLASSLYHLSATHRPAVVPQDAFPNTPTSSMHRQPPWTSPVLEPHVYGWPSTPSASASASTSSSSSGTSPDYNEEEDEMMLDSPIPSGPNALFPPPAGRLSAGTSGGSGGRPCTPVLPATVTTTTAITNTSLVQPNTMSQPHFHFHYHHSGLHRLNETSDTAYDPTANSFATSDPFYIDLQQQQQQQQQQRQQRSRTLQATPLSFQAQGQAPGYSVQYAPLLRQNPTQAYRGAPNLNAPPSSSSSPSSSSASNPFALRPRY